MAATRRVRSIWLTQRWPSYPHAAWRAGGCVERFAGDSGVLLDLSAIKVDHDTHGIVIEWGTAGDDFEQNLSRLLVEVRFWFSGLRPQYAVNMETAKVWFV
ncbi:hypothetical protein [Rhodococcus sp. 05-340-1]|uniref:hypothetical protein n=1 Tax=Rhodococcus sp. 05-340-1 TaxID=2022505 RepID=UPI00211B327A|nr:hypothetical protein [Rhodococcus sp. 05-340-1]